MPLLCWSAQLSVGVAEFDEEHRGLLGLLNELYDAMQLDQGAATLPAIFEDLATYTAVHFAHEEQMMALHRFPELPAHSAEHRALIKQLEELRLRYERDGAGVVLTTEVLSFLKNWLLKHIHGTDKRYGPYLGAMRAVTPAPAARR
jgi:hemerythrin